MKSISMFPFLLLTMAVFDTLSLCAAAYLENIASVKYYQVENIQRWWNQVWDAVDAGKVDVVRELCVDQPEARMFCLTHDSNEEDMTVLCHAAYRGHYAIVVCLIKEFSVPIERPGLSSALHAAIIGGHSRIVRYLLGLGVSPDDRDEGGRTPLHFAAMFGYPDILCLLIKAGAVTGLRDNHGNTPLCCAVVQNHYALLFYLLWKGGAGPEAVPAIMQLVPDYACITQRRHRRFVSQLSAERHVTGLPPELDDLVAKFVYHVC